MRLAITIAIVVTAVLVGAVLRAVVRPGDEQEILIVDPSHEAASTDGPGTAAAPYSTISRAVAEAQGLTADGQPVTVEVGPGVYPESVDIAGTPDAAHLTIAGAGPDRVIVTGADRFTNWRTDPDHAEVLVHPWRQSWGFADLPTQGWRDFFADNAVGDVVRRQEVVWHDDQPLRQVLRRAQAEQGEGTFFVDEAADELVVHPGAGASRDDPLEVAVRESLLDVSDRSGVTVRGMTFQRAATPLQGAALRFTDTDHVLVEDVRAIDNNWAGVAVQRSSDVTLKNVAANDNGVLGVSVFQATDVALLNIENSRNNTWRGSWGGYFGWEAGAKVFAARGVQIEGWRAEGNAANGLWLDTDVSDVVIEDAVLAGNLRRGLFLEAVQGPVVVRNSVVCGNRDDGIVDGKSDNVTLEDNTVYANRGAQLLISGEAGGRTFTTFDGGEERTIRSVNWTVRNNTFAAGPDGHLVESHLTETEFAAFTQTLASDGNRWIATEPDAFHTAAGITDFAGWRDLTTQDGASSSTSAGPRPDCPPS